MFELTLGQGQKVTVQGQICTMVKKMKIVKKKINRWIDVGTAYTFY